MCPDTNGANNAASVHDDPVLVFDASTQEEAEVVHATLVASGLHATMDHVDASPIVGAVDPSIGSSWRRGVYVSASDADAAREIISASLPTEEELTLEEEADTTTLQEAEIRANAN